MKLCVNTKDGESLANESSKTVKMTVWSAVLAGELIRIAKVRHVQIRGKTLSDRDLALWAFMTNSSESKTTCSLSNKGRGTSVEEKL